MSKLTEEARLYLECPPVATTSRKTLSESLIESLVGEIENSPVERLERWKAADTSHSCVIRCCRKHKDSSWPTWSVQLYFANKKGFHKSIYESENPDSLSSLNAVILAVLGSAEEQEQEEEQHACLGNLSDSKGKP